MKMDDKRIGLEKLSGYGSKEAVIQNLKDGGAVRTPLNAVLIVWTVVKKQSF